MHHQKDRVLISFIARVTFSIIHISLSPGKGVALDFLQTVFINDKLQSGKVLGVAMSMNASFIIAYKYMHEVRDASINVLYNVSPQQVVKVKLKKKRHAVVRAKRLGMTHHDPIALSAVLELAFVSLFHHFSSFYGGALPSSEENCMTTINSSIYNSTQHSGIIKHFSFQENIRCKYS